MVANQPKVLSVDEFLAHERDVDFGHRVDWYDKLLNKSNLGQSHYLAVSGGSENLTFRASANYKKKDGLDIASSRKEYGVRIHRKDIRRSVRDSRKLVHASYQ